MKTLSSAGAAALILALAVLLGCARQTTTTTEERTDTQQKVEARLDQLRAEIDTLDAKARDAGGAVKADLEERVRGLQAQRDSAAVQLRELQQAGDRAWEGAKAGTDRMLERLEASIAAARERLESSADST